MQTEPLRTRLKPLVFFVLAISVPGFAVDTQYMQGVGDAHYHHIESENVGRAYHVFVKLPEGYEQSEDKTYPTIYLLDGGWLFPLLTAYYWYLNFGGEVPDAIIVGISYGGVTFEQGNHRGFDYTVPSTDRDDRGGAADFQSFLDNELLPYIEHTYRSDSGRRIIFGQSLGGQFVLFTALTKPTLFWGHIASNPALPGNPGFFFEQHPPGTGATRGKLFVGSGTLDDPRFREPALAWIKHWSGRNDNPWILESSDLDGHSHMSAPPASFRLGMRWLFADEVQGDR